MNGFVVGLTLTMILGGLVLIIGPIYLRRRWDNETQRNWEHDEFDRKVKRYNDDIANRQRDYDIVSVLSGRETPTVVDRYRDKD
ncbi:hypothetical protein [Herpetosiphon gulosus]|uniref:Uncharacterized protein n=1 Tax=Herpetosiphon gulosus TaxID=1973496 RepID=A0ABP9X3P5_9CHLR